MDNIQYKKMCLDILDNALWYRSISFEDLDSFTIDFYRLVDRALTMGSLRRTSGNLSEHLIQRSLYLFIVYLNFTNRALH